MKFSDEFIEKVRAATDLVDIIGPYADLKGGSSRLMARCPFPDHQDRSPSFSVSREAQFYNCFGCGKGGDVFTFLSSYHGMTFPEAVEYLARRASIPFEFEQSTGGPTRGEKDELLRINRAAADLYHRELDTLPRTHPAKAYLLGRGIDRGSAVKFQLGFCAGDGLIEELRAKDLPVKGAHTLGLLRRKENAPETEFFRGKIIFPILSPSADVIGFGGRVVDDGMPKYFNSSESIVFKKGSALYGLSETGKYIRAADQAIVVEGYLDAISLYRAGITNVVGILGTAFTWEHARLLKRYTANVIMLLDGDAAGLAGAERSFPILLEAHILPKGLVLPDDQDPDDFVKAAGAELLRKEVERAPDLFSLLLKKIWLADYRGTAIDKIRVLERVKAALATCPNRNLASLYSMEVTQHLDVKQAWLMEALAMPKPGTRAVSAAVSVDTSLKAPPAISLKGAPRDEGMVFSLLVNYEELLADLVGGGFDELERAISHPAIRAMLATLRYRYGTDKKSFPKLAAEFVSQVDEPYVITVAIGVEKSSIEELRKTYQSYAKSILKRYLRDRTKALKEEIGGADAPEKLRELRNLFKRRFELEND